MTKYLVVCRPSDQAVAHADDTPEEAVCNIARTLMNLPMRADQLMAIPADTDLATMSLLKDDVMCSVDVTEKSIETWRNDVTNNKNPRPKGRGIQNKPSCGSECNC